MSASDSARRHPPGIRLSDVLADRAPNRFGLVRLALALTVIGSHTCELLDGNRSNEFLFRVTRNITFGEAAVLGFFFVSGLLVTASYATTPDCVVFCRKRAARILPGFAVAYCVTLLVAAPLAGGHLDTLAGVPGLEAVMRLIFAMEPTLDGAYAGAADPRLNASMWTIPYEIRCYALTAVLGMAGLLLQQRFYLWLTCAVVMATLLQPWFDWPAWLETVAGEPAKLFRLLVAFATGACFFLFRDKVVLHGTLAATAALLFALMLCLPVLAFSIAPALGGYALLWLVFAGVPGRIGSIGRTVDISYGLYLYAWPVQNTLVWFIPNLSPLLQITCATPIAALLGYLSWTYIEKPAMALNARHRQAKLSPSPD